MGQKVPNLYLLNLFHFKKLLLFLKSQLIANLYLKPNLLFFNSLMVTRLPWKNSKTRLLA